MSFAKEFSLTGGCDVALEYWHGQIEVYRRQIIEVGYRLSLHTIRKLSVHLNENIRGMYGFTTLLAQRWGEVIRTAS